MNRRTGIARWVRPSIGLLLLVGLTGAAMGSQAATDVVVPTAVGGPGAGGTQGVTTLWLRNWASAPVTVQLSFLQRDVSNTAPVTREERLGAGESRRYDDVVGKLFGVKGAAGGIRIRATGSVQAFSRTFEDGEEEAKESVGTSLDALPTGTAVGVGGTTTLLGASSEGGGASGSEVGLAEVDGKPATVRLTVKAEGGKTVGTAEVSVRPQELKQLSLEELFPGVETVNAAVEVTVSDGEGRVMAFTTPKPRGGEEGAVAEVPRSPEEAEGGAPAAAVNVVEPTPERANGGDASGPKRAAIDETARWIVTAGESRGCRYWTATRNSLGPVRVFFLGDGEEFPDLSSATAAAESSFLGGVPSGWMGDIEWLPARTVASYVVDKNGDGDDFAWAGIQGVFYLENPVDNFELRIRLSNLFGLIYVHSDYVFLDASAWADNQVRIRDAITGTVVCESYDGFLYGHMPDIHDWGDDAFTVNATTRRVVCSAPRLLAGLYQVEVFARSHVHVSGGSARALIRATIDEGVVGSCCYVACPVTLPGGSGCVFGV